MKGRDAYLAVKCALDILRNHEVRGGPDSLSIARVSSTKYDILEDNRMVDTFEYDLERCGALWDQRGKCTA